MGQAAVQCIGIKNNDYVRLHMVGKDRGRGRAAVDPLCFFRKEFLELRARTTLATVEWCWSQVILWNCYQCFNY